MDQDLANLDTFTTCSQGILHALSTVHNSKKIMVDKQNTEIQLHFGEGRKHKETSTCYKLILY